MDANIKPKNFGSALDYIEAIRSETPGDDAQKLNTWRTEDAATCSKQARITAVRILIGMEMNKAYGTPAPGGKQAKRREVAAQYDIGLRRAYDYMVAANAFVRATGLHIPDGDSDGLVLPVAVFDREVQEVPAYVHDWTQGIDHDERASRIADADITRPPSPDPKEKPQPKSPSPKAWANAGEKFLTVFPEVEGATLRDLLLEHGKLLGLRLADLTVFPEHRTKDGILSELEVLLNRASMLPDGERWDTVRALADRAWKQRQIERERYEEVENERQRCANRASIEEYVRTGGRHHIHSAGHIGLREVKGLHPAKEVPITRDLLVTYGLNELLHLYPAPVPVAVSTEPIPMPAEEVVAAPDGEDVAESEADGDEAAAVADYVPPALPTEEELEAILANAIE